MTDATVTQKAIYTALTGIFSGKVYPAIAPDQASPPYVVYQIVGSTPHVTLANGEPVESNRYQVDIWASNYDQAHQLALQAKAALLALSFPIAVTSAGHNESFEADIKLHRVIEDFNIFEPRRI